MEQIATEDATWNRQHLYRLARAYVMTRTLLRVGKLHLALSGIERQKDECGGVGSFDADEVRRLVAAFSCLRLFFYTPRERCLFDSLVLTRFLIGYGVAPSLVIGVTMRPFHAHCWVQFGDAVLVGELDFIRRYGPILVI
jgi:hypothetical protein